VTEQGWALMVGVSAIPLWQQVADGIRQAIQAGRLRAGDRVVEAQLARQLGISRNPIREALRQLQEQGILEYRPNLGTVVARAAPADAQVAVEMRAFMEARAVRLAIEAGRLAALLSALAPIAEQMGALSPDAPLAQAESLDAAFHQTLIAASGSALLQRAWATVDPYTWVVMAGWEGRSPDYRLDYAALAEDHRRLLGELRQGDAAAAEAAVHRHILTSWERLKASEQRSHAVSLENADS
jgi:DNA-binding GntR family transcriptional regulator